MPDDSTPALRLTVWRPARIARPLMGYDESGRRLNLFGEDYLQEEVFSWQTTEEFRNSLSSEDAGKVAAALFDAFAPHLEPTQRKVEKLTSVMDALRSAITRAGNDAWSDTLSIARHRDETVNLHGNPALSLLLLLEWIHAVFRDVPGVSVTAR